MGTSAEIYEYEKILKGALKSLGKSPICEENKALVESFSRYLFAQGLSPGRVIKYTIEARRLSEQLGKAWKDAGKDDVIELVQKIEVRKDYTEYTKHDYKLTIKKFFKFLKKTEDYPEEVRWIKLTSKICNRKLPEELLTEDEVRRMAEAARTQRDRALILALYESGCRIGELLSLRIRNVRFDEYGAVLMVDGKTGMRRVRVIASAPSLAAWLNIHPLRDNLDAHVWVSLGTRSRDTLLTYTAIADLLRKITRKAGIKKRVYPHLFRHSRATHLANHLTEAQMKQYFGWVQGSDMASVYVHLSGRDVDNALLKLNGMEVNEEAKEQAFKPLTCPRCKNRNSPDTKFCSTCGSCLDARTAVEIDGLREKADMLMSELVKNPNVLNALLEGIDKLKNENKLLESEIISNGYSPRAKKIQERQD